MSRKYDNSRDVPTETLANRLYELSDAVTCGQKGLDREFTMRIPAECDRDADIVLAESARRLGAADTELAAAKARIAEQDKYIEQLRDYNFGLATESEQQKARIADLEKALEPFALTGKMVPTDFSDFEALTIHVPAQHLRRAAALLKEKE